MAIDPSVGQSIGQSISAKYAVQGIAGQLLQQDPSLFLSNIFRQIDTAGVGSITSSQFSASFANLPLPSSFKTQGANALFNQIDPKGLGTVTQGDFISQMEAFLKDHRAQDNKAKEDKTQENQALGKGTGGRVDPTRDAGGTAAGRAQAEAALASRFPPQLNGVGAPGQGGPGAPGAAAGASAFPSVAGVGSTASLQGLLDQLAAQAGGQASGQGTGQGGAGGQTGGQSSRGPMGAEAGLLGGATPAVAAGAGAQGSVGGPQGLGTGGQGSGGGNGDLARLADLQRTYARNNGSGGNSALVQLLGQAGADISNAPLGVFLRAHA